MRSSNSFSSSCSLRSFSSSYFDDDPAPKYHASVTVELSCLSSPVRSKESVNLRLCLGACRERSELPCRPKSLKARLGREGRFSKERSSVFEKISLGLKCVCAGGENGAVSSGLLERASLSAAVPQFAKGISLEWSKNGLFFGNL